MRVDELIRRLQQFPGDMEVGVNMADVGALDLDVNLEVAVNHPDTYHGDRTWHWEWSSGPSGTRVVVVH